MKQDQLGLLVRLAEARKAGAIARLDALMAQLRACQAEIADAEKTYGRDMAEQVEVPMSQRALRSVWADQRIALALRNIAALAPAIAAARAAAIQGLGKHQALETLADKAERDGRLVRASRLEREAPAAEPQPD